MARHRRWHRVRGWCALLALAVAALVSGAAGAQSRGAPIFAVTQGEVVVRELRGTSTVLVEKYSVDADCPGFGSACLPRSADAGDWTGDGADELVHLDFAGFSFTPDVVVVDAIGAELDRVDAGAPYAAVALGDINGSGADEILLVPFFGGSLDVYEGGAIRSSGIVVDSDAIVDAGDVDGDGVAEIVVADGATIKIYRDGGEQLASFVSGEDVGDLGVGDVDGDGFDEIVVRDDTADPLVIRTFDGSGIEETVFTNPGNFGSSMRLAVADARAGGAEEVLLRVRGDLDVIEHTGVFVGQRVDFFSGGRRLAVGDRAYPDADGDGLLDSWETSGIDVDGDVLPLQLMGADPDHKDLFLEIDWMRDPTRTESGDGSDARPRLPTCSDGVDNDGDAMVDTNDIDCFNTRLSEAGGATCNDGIDNDNNGDVDGNDTSCLIVDGSLPEGMFASVFSCSDTLDNNGDGRVDMFDPACWVVDPTRAEAARSSCGDGFDNDNDGTIDAADLDCRDPLFAEASVDNPATAANEGSCGDGFDNDGDGRIDTDDLDCVHAPTQLDVRRMKAAFCAAPPNAGGVLNPDGRPGIDVHVQAGPLADGNGAETGVMPCTCNNDFDDDSDGLADADDPDCLGYHPLETEAGGGSCIDNLDNDGDGQIDAEDSDCLVFDPRLAETSIGPGTCRDGLDNDGDGSKDLADINCFVGDTNISAVGGNEVPLETLCGLGGDFDDIKKDHFANFIGQEAWPLVFRYGLSAAGCGGNGGQGTIGGTDFVDFNHDGGSIMHEFGHNLNLRHGGNNDENCKPNYVSVMNYTQQFGIRQRGAPPILDYSPPRFTGGRGQAPLATLDEADLDESDALDATDPSNFFVFSDGGGRVQQLFVSTDADANGVRSGVDWDGDGDATSTSTTANIDAALSKCANNDSDDVLDGHDDWSSIRLSLRLGTESSNALPTPNPTVEEMETLTREAARADVGVVMAPSTSPVEVGDPFDYIVRVVNVGPNAARDVAASFTLPERVELVEAPGFCDPADEGHECALGSFEAGRVAEIVTTVDTDGACVDGVPLPLESAAGAKDRDRLGGLDPNDGNNDAMVTTELIDTTAPAISCNIPDAISPDDAPVTVTASAVDVCTGAVVPEVTAFDCFKFTKKGRRVDKRESCLVSFEGASVTVHDSGGVADRISWTVRAEDVAGNVSEADCELMIVLPLGGM